VCRYERLALVTAISILAVFLVQFLRISCERVMKRRRQKVEEGFLRDKETPIVN
jgi:hypothetical protein